MKRQIKIWGTRTLAIVLVVFGAQHWGVPFYKEHFTPKKKSVYIPTAKVREGKFVVSFHDIGALQAENSRVVISEINGKIIKLVPDGTNVKANEVICQLDTTDIEKEIRNEVLNYENAEAEVKRAHSEREILKESNRTELTKAEAQFKFDENELERARKDLEKEKRLAKEKLVPYTNVEKAEFEVRSKELALTKAEMDLELKKKEIRSKEEQKDADVRNVEFKRDMARFRKDEVQSRMDKAVIRAPSSGLVVISTFWGGDGRRQIKEGDSIHQQQRICELPDLTNMQVKVKVGEADAPRVQLNMPVLIRLEAVPKKVFHGKVQDISSLAVQASPWEGEAPGRKNFEVTVAVKESDPKTLKPGMTADAEFLCDQLDKARYVPMEAVTEERGKTYVFVKEGGRYTRTEVEIGKHNDNFVCITKGLKAGQVVALRDPTKPLEEQEAGTGGSEEPEEKTSEKKTAPIPNAGGATSDEG
ncbi:MAG: efflux RND transporter periplasmic adaptor subunit [Armatimonadetes bacterium]|nr:efflux RND transporter periplasmic adaptor subunit [Armatimonadota bacterium]